MKKNGIGGANTKTGSIFEGKTDLQTFLCAQKGYSCKKNEDGLMFFTMKSRLLPFLRNMSYIVFLNIRG